MLLIALLLKTVTASIVESDLSITVDCPLSFDYLYPSCQNWDERDFDFIIVGAGTAGSTLAARLSENPNWNVLLIEAGGVPSNLSEVPGLFEAIQKTPEDWAFRTRPSRRVSTGYINSVSSWAKGRALGGSSTINSMVTVPGVPADYDAWAAMGNEGWNWDNVTEYFSKVEREIKVTRYRIPDPFRAALEEAVQKLGVDSTGSSVYGYRDVPMEIDGGQRYNFAKAFLSPIRNRPNLCVVTGKLVTGVWFDHKETVKGILLEDTRIKANVEVILSAGAINTPKLLMLSGIGPKKHLHTLGIEQRADLPVGRNLMDHLVVQVWLKANITSEPIASIESRLEDYCRDRTMLNNGGVTNYQGYINTRNTTSDLAPQPNIELIHFAYEPQEYFLNLSLDRLGLRPEYQTRLLQINVDTRIQGVMVDLLHPKSRGTIELRDTDPESMPIINPRYLEDPDDVEVILEGIQFVEQLFSTPSLSNYEFIDLGVASCAEYQFRSPDYWRCFSRTFATTVYHPSGTCSMGNSSGRSVVNPRLEVWGMPKLRVVDSSVIPALMSGHTNIPTGMLAEKAADMIKEDFNY